LYSFLLNFICGHYDIDLVEFHLDLDGKGYEYGPGHCWKPEEIQDVIKYKFVKNIFNQLSLKNTKKQISKKEKAERDWRADPVDGLRPLYKKRKNKCYE
jgi:N-acetylneuraminate synthase